MEENPLNNFLAYTVPVDLTGFFRKQAQQKIDVEGWAKQGRNFDVKVNNFVNCWTTEEAFKQLLIQKKKWFRNRGLYFGDSQGAGADFIVKMNGKEISVGLRSVNSSSLTVWKSVAYPDDRFRDEKDKIAQHHIVCHNENGHVKFFGIISKENLLQSLQLSPRLHSRKNQEHFRIIPLEQFRFSDLERFIEKLDES